MSNFSKMETKNKTKYTTIYIFISIRILLKQLNLFIEPVKKGRNLKTFGRKIPNDVILE